MVNRTSLKVVLLMLGVFLAGAGSGAAWTHSWSHRHMGRMLQEDGFGYSQQRVRALQRVLGLSPRQRKDVSTILEQDVPERWQLMGELMQSSCGERIRLHRAEIDARIRGLLGPAQQQKFDKLIQSRAERWRARDLPKESAAGASRDAGQ